VLRAAALALGATLLAAAVSLLGGRV